MSERPDASAPPAISVVIPVHGDRGGLRRTLEHLAAQTTDTVFEVVVVDNGDNPGIDETVAARRRVRLVREAVPGSYPARNTGARHARGEVLAFTDADCLPDPEWLEAGTSALAAAGPSTFAGGRIDVVAEGGHRRSAAELWQLGYDLRQEVYVTERGWAATANLFVRRADFDRVGPFATDLESGGDREWGERATSRGVRAVYAEAASIRHPARRTLRQLHAKIRRVTRGAVVRHRAEGVAVHPGGWLRAARPIVRSAWHQSRRASDRQAVRLRFVAVALWIHYYRLLYGWWLLRRSRWVTGPHGPGRPTTGAAGATPPPAAGRC